jgi:hypothetical protein
VTDCTAIAALPAVITTTGIHCLTGNLNFNAATGKAITIQAGPVVLDMNGFAISNLGAGTGTQAIGILSNNRKDVTIRNGTIRGFDYGVKITGATAIGHLIEDLRLETNRTVGISLESGANGIIVRNNQILNTGGSTVNDSGVGIQVLSANSIKVQDNTIIGSNGSFSAFGISIFGTDLVEVINNSVLNTLGGENPSTAVSVHTSNNVTIINNRLLNGATPGQFGIVGTSSDFNCINNVIARFNTAISTCTFVSGNLTPP